MSKIFNVGDLVQLKSGGQAMTVEEINGNEVGCVWQEGKQFHRQVFVAATLKPYERPGLGTIRLTRG